MNVKSFALAIGVVLSLLIPGHESAYAGDNRIDLIQERGKLLVCHLEQPPWSYKDSKTGKWVGDSVESAKYLATALGVDYKAISADFWTRITYLETGKCDIHMSPTFPTVEYVTRVLFSDPIGYAFNSVAVHIDSPLQTHKDVDQEGITVIVGPSLESELLAERFYKRATVKYLENEEGYSSYYLEVDSRRADALLYDNGMIKEFIKKNPEMNLRIIDDAPLNPEGYAYAVPLGEYHFINLINFLFKRIEQTGGNYQWFQKISSE